MRGAFNRSQQAEVQRLVVFCEPILPFLKHNRLTTLRWRLQVAHFLGDGHDLQRRSQRLWSALAADPPHNQNNGLLERLQHASAGVVDACLAAHPVMRSPRPVAMKLAMLPRAMHLAAVCSCATERGEWVLDAADAVLAAHIAELLPEAPEVHALLITTPDRLDAASAFDNVAGVLRAMPGEQLRAMRLRGGGAVPHRGTAAAGAAGGGTRACAAGRAWWRNSTRRCAGAAQRPSESGAARLPDQARRRNAPRTPHRNSAAADVSVHQQHAMHRGADSRASSADGPARAEPGHLPSPSATGAWRRIASACGRGTRTSRRAARRCHSCRCPCAWCRCGSSRRAVRDLALNGPTTCRPALRR
jgi:hypothetical protein